MSEETKLLFSRKAAAAILDLSVRSIDYLVASGELEYRKVGRKVLIPRASLTRFAGSDHKIEKGDAHESHFTQSPR
jgi:excisionase family DNA binding protein